MIVACWSKVTPTNRTRMTTIVLTSTLICARTLRWTHPRRVLNLLRKRQINVSRDHVCVGVRILWKFRVFFKNLLGVTLLCNIAINICSFRINSIFSFPSITSSQWSLSLLKWGSVIKPTNFLVCGWKEKHSSDKICHFIHPCFILNNVKFKIDVNNLCPFISTINCGNM